MRRVYTWRVPRGKMASLMVKVFQSMLKSWVIDPSGVSMCNNAELFKLREDPILIKSGFRSSVLITRGKLIRPKEKGRNTNAFMD